MVKDAIDTIKDLYKTNPKKIHDIGILDNGWIRVTMSDNE